MMLRTLPLFLLAAFTSAQDEKDVRASKEPTAFEFGSKKVKHSIDLKEIRKGNPRWPADPRDRIPAIYKPKITTAQDAERVLKKSDRILGVVIEDEARAYPLFILQVHEMCNDRLAGRPIAPNF